MLNNDTAKAEYKIWDSQKQFYLPTSYKTRRSANRVADAKNREYGAGRYYVTFLNSLGTIHFGNQAKYLEEF
jgi:hypothetical protein